MNRQKFNESVREYGNKTFMFNENYGIGDLLTKRINLKKTFGLSGIIVGLPIAIPASIFRYGNLKTNEDPAIEPIPNGGYVSSLCKEFPAGILEFSKIYYDIGYDLGELFENLFYKRKIDKNLLRTFGGTKERC